MAHGPNWGPSVSGAIVVLCEGRLHVLDGPRVASSNDHGSGCTLSAATAAVLALGADPLVAVTRAKDFVTAALRGSASWHLGAGHGPLDHFGWGDGPLAPHG